MERRKRTVQEKYEYNKVRRQDNPFSAGYAAGVEIYRQYGSLSPKDRKNAQALNRSMAKAAEKCRDQASIGYMCALRDCANERKGK